MEFMQGFITGFITAGISSAITATIIWASAWRVYEWKTAKQKNEPAFMESAAEVNERKKRDREAVLMLEGINEVLSYQPGIKKEG